MISLKYMSFYSIIISNLKYLIPLLASLFFSIITIMPIMPIGYESIAPLLGVVSMAFWIMHRPDIMSWFFVIIIGFYCDVLYGTILGSGVLSSIIIRFVITKVLYKLEPINIYHTLFYLSTSLFIWLFVSVSINSIINLEAYNFFNTFFQGLISIIISPIVIFSQLYLLKKISI